MYDYSGIIYKFWTCGFLAFGGIFCLRIAWKGSTDDNKETTIAGFLGVVYAVILAIYYSNCIINPDIKTFHAMFDYEQKKPRAAFVTEYNFRDEDNSLHYAYLDSFSKKEIISEDFQKGEWYTVYYEGRTETILKVEKGP